MKKRKKEKKPKWGLLLLLLVGAISYKLTESVNLASYAIGAAFAIFINWKFGRVIYKKWRFRRAGIYAVDEMTGEEFEEFLGELFERCGFDVSYTKGSGDFGADLILEDDGEIIVVQAKRYQGTVGVKAVQEIVGAVKMYEADEAWVVTNSYFTKQAKELAESNDVFLMDRDKLIEFMLKM